MRNRRVHGSTVTTVAVTVRMATDKATVRTLASAQPPVVTAVKAASSVRNRNKVPAAL
jgi:hypothetical protein